MNEILEVLGGALRRAWQIWSGPGVRDNLAAVAVLTLLVFGFEWCRGRAWRRYFSRGARTDALYTVFYLAGFYGFLISGPLSRLLDRATSSQAPWLRADLLAGLPAAAHFVILLVVIDGIGYWVHRWTHASRLLWAFHSIHHSQVDLTPLSNTRFHFADSLLKGFCYAVAGTILGVPPVTWLPAVWLNLWLGGLAHSDLGWSYGPLEKLVVSPRFHSTHHSSESRHLNSNFGLTFSFWDHLFGTASQETRRPQAYGAPDLDVPESFVRQAFFPFLHLARGVRERRGVRASEA